MVLVRHGGLPLLFTKFYFFPLPNSYFISEHFLCQFLKKVLIIGIKRFAERLKMLERLKVPNFVSGSDKFCHKVYCHEYSSDKNCHFTSDDRNFLNADMSFSK